LGIARESGQISKKLGERKMKRKGFTLVELLVVIAIIALLMGILMPALAKVKQLAARMVCGSHLSGIGKAMLVYSNDHKQEYPRSGWAQTKWNIRLIGGTLGWKGKTREEAYGLPTSTQTDATITSCFYLLVKYTDVTVKHFMCKGDYGVEPFDMHELREAGLTDYTEAWDFGRTGTAGEGVSPAIHCSYSYHLPFVAPTQIGGVWRDISFAVQPSSDPSSPLCADLNPYLDRGATGQVSLDDIGYLDNPDFGVVAYWDPVEGYKDPDRTANASSHQREGQNVLYNDGHVRFESTPNVGIERDNIWKYWSVTSNPSKEEKELGIVGIAGVGNPEYPSNAYAPKSEADAFLVNEINPTKVSIK
jgi:prepilin-type N-terminal cleavage/methylation domain-containing protein